MKRLFILTLTILCLGVTQEAYAEIKNGYDHQINQADQWLSQLHKIANGPLNELEQEKMKKRLEEAHATVDKLRENHAKTQELIEMFKMVAPELYQEVNTIKDSEGNETDIYIKVVDKLGQGLHGATNVNHSVSNPNVYSSEYGDYTVSVKIAHVNPIKDLWSLVHELGHVRYQVAYLADYAAFYQKVYQDQHFAGIPGHHPDDLSGYFVKETLKTFKKCWKKCNKELKQMIQNNVPQNTGLQPG